MLLAISPGIYSEVSSGIFTLVSRAMYSSRIDFITLQFFHQRTRLDFFFFENSSEDKLYQFLAGFSSNRSKDLSEIPSGISRKIVSWTSPRKLFFFRKSWRIFCCSLKFFFDFFSKNFIKNCCRCSPENFHFCKIF